MACCADGCPCPNDLMLPGSFYKKIPQDPCCICLLDDGDCSTISGSANPHRHWLGHCDCECDPEKGGQQGSWSYEYDEDGAPISRTWNGECDPDSPTPDWDSEKCTCYCKAAVEGCDNPQETVDAECKCNCLLSETDCSPPTPSLDTEACECVPCTKSPGDCSGATPSLDPDKCKCYCPYDDPNGSNKCPENLPYLDSQKCECYCPDSLADSCTTEQYFDSTTCSCKNCAVPCEGANIRSTNCECICPLDLPSGTNCPDSEPYLDTIQCKCYCPSSVSSGCADDEVFDSATCACVYDVTKLSLDFIP